MINNNHLQHQYLKDPIKVQELNLKSVQIGLEIEQNMLSFVKFLSVLDIDNSIIFNVIQGNVFLSNTWVSEIENKINLMHHKTLNDFFNKIKDLYLKEMHLFEDFNEEMLKYQIQEESNA